jgi:hypothetical protein
MIKDVAKCALLVTMLALVQLTLSSGSARAADEFERYALESASASLSTTQAGAHADMTTDFVIAQSTEGSEPKAYALTREIEVALPQGVIGNPQAISRCTVAQLGNLPAESECPFASQVGVTEIGLGGSIKGHFSEPIYNMESPGGDVVARLGFFALTYPAFINIRLDPIDDSLVATIEGAPSAAGLLEASTTLWGVPAGSSHDGERMTPHEVAFGMTPPTRHVETPEAPFMTNPTACGMSRQVSITARSYQLPNDPSSLSVPYPEITGCGSVSFGPTFTITPTNSEAAAPTGVDADLRIPQDETPNGRGTSTLKSAVVSLPEGMTVNSAAADGLEACSAAQVGFESSEASHCPAGSKIGSVELDVPALEHTLNGSVYQRTPEPGHLFRFWLVTDEQGVHLKLPAEIETNPVTGRLTTVFNGIPSIGGNPQVPLADLKLHIFGGPRAPLSTPGSCGTYQTHFSFTPWSGRAPAEGDAPMQIATGCGKGGFRPSLSAGTLSARAGSYSPFTLTVTRSDGEANPVTLSATLPKGVVAKLAGVPLCPESAMASGACPAASQVGTVTAATGVGGAPLWVPQPGKEPTAVYLAGPYKGAPYSILAKVPAQAGPFDLGTVLTRSGIYVDPETAVVTVKSDPLPQILEGVPLQYRAINVTIDRPEFTLNATNCSAMWTTVQLVANTGAVANPSAAYQATNCARLAFEPSLKLSFSGQTKRLGNPAVKAVLTQPKGQNANIGGATVILPKGMFIAQAHVNNPCTRVQFNSGAQPGEGCPAKSILGSAKVWTPLLEQPEEGKVYFRSNGGERQLPDLAVALRGQIPLQLVGFIDSVGKKGAEVRRVRSRFLNLPDAPVSRFELKLSGGKKGLLENSKNLCKGRDRAKFQLSGQNGAAHDTEPEVQVSCGKGKRPKKS